MLLTKGFKKNFFIHLPWKMVWEISTGFQTLKFIYLEMLKKWLTWLFPWTLHMQLIWHDATKKIFSYCPVSKKNLFKKNDTPEGVFTPNLKILKFLMNFKKKMEITGERSSDSRLWNVFHWKVIFLCVRF